MAGWQGIALAPVTTQWHPARGSPAPLATKLSTVNRPATLPASHQSVTLHGWMAGHRPGTRHHAVASSRGGACAAPLPTGL